MDSLMPGPPSAAMQRLAFLVALTGLLTGCGVQEEAQEPGVRGPVVLRLWARQARQQGLPPTVVRTAAVHQVDSAFQDMQMVPVQIRHPLRDGELWIYSPTGHFHASGESDKQPQVSLQGPVYVTGVMRGLPVSGSAATADVPPGRSVIILTDVRLVRGGMLMTTPTAEISEGQVLAHGPVSLAPGAPAITAVLGAIP
jgi:hypothetical protein